MATPPLQFGKPGAPTADTVTAVLKESDNAKSDSPNRTTAQSTPIQPEGDAQSPDMVIFTSHPVKRLNIGVYKFVDGQMSLERGSREHQKFEKLLETQPHQVKNMVKRIATPEEAAAALARLRESQSRVTTGVTTTSGSIGPDGSVD